MTELDFLNALDDDPDELDTYLAYADWLEESGEAARGQMIRLEVGREQTGIELAGVRWAEVFHFGWVRGVPGTTHVRDKAPAADVLDILPGFPWLTTLSSRTVPRADLVLAVRPYPSPSRSNGCGVYCSGIEIVAMWSASRTSGRRRPTTRE